MTKAEIRSGLKNTLPKIDKVGKYHNRYLDFCIETVLNKLYQEIHANSPLDLQRYTKRFGGTNSIAVAYDAGAGLYYSNYPAKVCVIDDKASGVRRISTVAQGGMTFYPLSYSELEYKASGSYSHTVSTKVGYVVTQDRIEYCDMTAAIAAAGVRMDLLVPFSVYADTDNVLIPEIEDRQGESFMDKVLKVLGVVQPVDLKDDNSNATETQNNRGQ